MHKLHHSTWQWLLGVISYVLDDGFSPWKPKLSFYLWVPVEHSNICLVNIEIHYHFEGCVIYVSAQNLLWLVTYFYCLESDWWPHFSAVRTMEFYCISPDHCLGYGYETRVTHGTILRDLSHGYLMGLFCISRPLGPSWAAFMLVKLT